MACSALYRQSKLGLSLVDALDQLVEEGKLPPQLALRILDEVRPCSRPGSRSTATQAPRHSVLALCQSGAAHTSPAADLRFVMGAKSGAV